MTARLSCRSAPVAPRVMAPAEEAPEVVGTWYSSRGMFFFSFLFFLWKRLVSGSCEMAQGSDGGDGRTVAVDDGVGEIWLTIGGSLGEREKTVAVEENFVRQNWAVRGNLHMDVIEADVSIGQARIENRAGRIYLNAFTFYIKYIIYCSNWRNCTFQLFPLPDLAVDAPNPGLDDGC